MKILIEFMTQAGRVPYFVEDRFPYLDGPLYVGISIDDSIDYVPDTLLVLSSEDVIARAEAATIYKLMEPMQDPVEYTVEEKHQLAVDWLTKQGQIV